VTILIAWKFNFKEIQLTKKCLIPNCENCEHQGAFIGELCQPCHDFITTNTGIFSQAYRNHVAFRDQCLVAFKLKDSQCLVYLLKELIIHGNKIKG